MKPSSVLVTGAAGFIGSSVVDSLLAAGADACGTVNVTAVANVLDACVGADKATPLL